LNEAAKLSEQVFAPSIASAISRAASATTMAVLGLQLDPAPGKVGERKPTGRWPEGAAGLGRLTRPNQWWCECDPVTLNQTVH